MKSKLFFLMLVFSLALSSCEKESDPPNYQIAGLWIGTYTVLSQPPLFFSFTIYPDGSLSYKSKGINGETFYANGTWTLTGNNFSYSVITVAPVANQTGTATYSNSGTLTNGTNTEVGSGLSGTLTMNRVN